MQKAWEGGNPDGRQHGSSRRSPALCDAGSQGRPGAGEMDTLPPKGKLSWSEETPRNLKGREVCPTGVPPHPFDCVPPTASHLLMQQRLLNQKPPLLSYRMILYCTLQSITALHDDSKTKTAPFYQSPSSIYLLNHDEPLRENCTHVVSGTTYLELEWDKFCSG